MNIKLACIAFILLFTAVSGCSFAEEQTSFVLDPENPEFDFVENELSTGECAR